MTMFFKSDRFKILFFSVLFLLCLASFISAAFALLIGLAFALLIGNPIIGWTQKASKKILALSVVGLGAGIDLGLIIEVGGQSLGITAAMIIFVMLIGFLLGKLFGLARDTNILIAVGTAICGGSAIAAAAPAIRARDEAIALSMAAVFMLNAVALVIFPLLGAYFGLDETSFGLWAALAIHDTSSVVGATLDYGPQALEVGTTTKLVRALWIVPLVLSLTLIIKTPKSAAPLKPTIKIPWFIAGFIALAVLFSFLPSSVSVWGEMIADFAKRGLVLSLFLIGASVSLDLLKKAGFKTLLSAILLWVIVATTSFILITQGVLNF